MKPLIRLSTRVVDQNPYWTYRHDRYQLPDGSDGDYWWVQSSGSVFVVPRLDADRFVLVRQHRYLNGRDSLEFPGGGLPAELSPVDAAARELREEAGLIAGRLTPLGRFNPCNGITDEMCTVFVADDLAHVGQKLEASEDIEVVTLDRRKILQAILDGTLWDGMTLAAWSLFQACEPEPPASP